MLIFMIGNVNVIAATVIPITICIVVIAIVLIVLTVLFMVIKRRGKQGMFVNDCFSV
jgi:hypothetical protein